MLTGTMAGNADLDFLQEAAAGAGVEEVPAAAGAGGVVEDVEPAAVEHAEVAAVGEPGADEAAKQLEGLVLATQHPPSPALSHG